MNNVYKVDYFGKLIAFYLTGISIFYTFYYSAVNIDKNVGILIFIGAFLLMVFKKNSLQLLCKNTLDLYLFFIGVLALVTVYFIQVIKFGTIINVEVFTILSIYSVLIFYKLTKDKFDYLFLVKFFGASMFFFLVINIVSFRGLSINISQQGFSSFVCYLCFIIFYFFFKSNIFLQIISGSLILITQTRILILSLIIIIIRVNDFNIKSIIKGFLIISIFGYFLYLLFPESRIFLNHTNGRLMYWERILNNFDFNYIWIGMGSGSSVAVLEGYNALLSIGRAHNEYIVYFFELGILGIIGLLCILKLIHSHSSNIGKVIFYNIMLQMFTDNIFTYYFNYLLPLILCILLESDQSLEKKVSLKMDEKMKI
jgi:hypothetical protein